MIKYDRTGYVIHRYADLRLKLPAVLCILFILMTQNANATEPADIKDTINAAKVCLEQKKADLAYDMLSPLEVDLAGSVDFDYVFGLAALDSGRPMKAILIFERILHVMPDFAGVRLDLGRAYFAMGNYDMAKKHFNKVLRLNPPPFAKKATQAYLDAIKRHQSRKKTLFTRYIEIKAGYDNNINTSTDESEIYTPALQLPISLSEKNIRKEDGYTGYGAGFYLNHKLPGNLFWGFRGDTGKRSHFNEIAFDPWNINISNSFGYETRADIFQLNMSCGLFILENDINKEQISSGLEWRHAVNSKNILTTFGQYAIVRFPAPELEIESFNQTTAGLSWFHSPGWSDKLYIITSIYGGLEEETQGRQNGDKDFGGLMAGVETFPLHWLTVFAGAGGYFGNYNKENDSFFEKREDRQFDARAGVKWIVADNFSVNPQVSYIRNNSNIEIYEYSRTDFSVTFRYDL